MDFREDFPILGMQVNGSPLIYLDNAATLQMPAPVLAAVTELYASYNGNVHRSGHTLGRTASEKMESARETVRRFINAASTDEIIFTSGTTGGINTLAQIYASQLLRPGDEVITTELEHHSNLLPWADACARAGAALRIAPMDARGDLDLDALGSLLSEKTRLLAVTWVSNAIGTVNPVEKLIAMAHSAGASVLIDAAQAVLHRSVDVAALGCDYLAFSGHKLGSLTGVGVLYGKKALLESFSPAYTGGGMVRAVRGAQAEYVPLPGRLEAGTPNYAGVISLGAAIDYICGRGREALISRGDTLLRAAERTLTDAGVHILGDPRERAGAVSFTADGIHPFDLAHILDLKGVAVRAGHHCAQNAVSHFGFDGTVRISPAFYNSESELSAFGEALVFALRMLKRQRI